MRKNHIFLMQYALTLFVVFFISSGLMAGTFGSEEFGEKKRKEKLCEKEPLTADGPYLLRQPDGSVRWVEVDVQGRVLDTLYTTLPADYTFRVTDHRGRLGFDVQLHPVQRPVAASRQPDKLFVMSDPHGRLDCVVSLLRGNDIIDKELRWSYGKNHLVVIGDIFDRGKDVTQICWFFYKLEAEAARAGGCVSFLLGNHEPMVLAGDMRYTKSKYARLAEQLGTSYPALWGPDTELGRWLATRNTMHTIGRHLFVHAGLSREFYERGLDVSLVNETMSQTLFLSRKERKAHSSLSAFLYGSDGPIWYRGLVRTDAKYHPLSADTLQLILDRYQVDRLIVGHTIFKDITTFYDGRVIGVNVDNKENREKKRGRALLIERNRYCVVGDKGFKRFLKF